MPRIEPLPANREPAELNIFRTLAHNKPLRKAFLEMGGYLLGGSGTLPAREREIVILRVGWRCGSEYEFGQHTVIGGAAGLTPEEIAALAGVGAHDWSEDDQALVAMADELCADDAVGDATWAALARRWDTSQVLELLLLSGYYRLVSGILNSAEVALEVGTPGWPDGADVARRAPRD